MTDAELDALLVDLRPMNGCNEFDRAVEAITFLRAAQVADRAKIRADALRDAAGMIGRIAKGYEDGGDGAIACGLYLTEGNVRAMIDTHPAASPDVAARVKVLRIVSSDPYFGELDAETGFAVTAALAKMKGGAK